MNDTLLFGVAAVPSIVGLVQVLKEMGLPGRFAPGASVLLGILAGVGQVFASAGGTNGTIAQAVVTGIALGLSASGLYSGATTVVARLTDSSSTDSSSSPADSHAAPASASDSTPPPFASASVPVPAPVAPVTAAQPVPPSTVALSVPAESIVAATPAASVTAGPLPPTQ